MEHRTVLHARLAIESQLNNAFCMQTCYTGCQVPLQVQEQPLGSPSALPQSYRRHQYAAQELRQTLEQLSYESSGHLRMGQPSDFQCSAKQFPGQSVHSKG